MINQSHVLLNNTIKINCETKDFEVPPPVPTEDATAGMVSYAYYIIYILCT